MKVEFREINEDDEELIWNIVYVTADMEKSGETLEQAKQNPDRRRYICDWESLLTMESLHKPQERIPFSSVRHG